MSRARIQYLGRVLALAAAYCVFARLGLLLAIPPGYATTIWLPSGIALAGLLLMGRRFWPGVWLGSFLANLSSNDSLSLAGAFAVAAGIGVGAALQAVVGSTLVRRYAGFPDAWDEPRNVFKWLLLGGPVSCLINSGFSASLLVFSGVASGAEFFSNWFTWWVGDAVGVVVCTPLVIFLGKGLASRMRPARLLVLILPFALTLTIAVGTFLVAHRWERQLFFEEFERKADDLTALVQTDVSLKYELARALASFLTSAPSLEEETIRALIRDVAERLPRLHSLHWRPAGKGREPAAEGESRLSFPVHNGGKLRGLVAGFDGGRIIRSVLADMPHEGIAVRVGAREAPSGYEIARSIRLPQSEGADWSLHFKRTRDFMVHYRPRQSWLVLVVGMTLCGLLEALLLTLIGQASRVERLVEQRSRELEESNRKLLHSAKIAAIGQMAAGIAHEISNPLTVIHSRGQQLRSKCESGRIAPEDIRGYADKIEATAQQAFRIIKGLRALVHDTGRDQPERIFVREVLANTVDFCEARFKRHQVELRVAAAPADLALVCHPTQIVQVLVNLLNNALDAVVGQPEKWVSVDVNRAGGTVVLSVTDSGPGVPPELRDKILEPFFTTKDSGSGMGLGLNLTLSIVERHGGRFFLDRTSPRTRFVVELPVQGA